MNIKRIEVENFRSFREIKIDLGNFNVLIGANASGKSNFVQLFAFLRDIARFGLNNALSIQGGVKYLRNIKIGASQNLTMKIIFSLSYERKKRTKEGFIGLRTFESFYEFSLQFNKRGYGFKVIKDKLTQKCEFIKSRKRQKNKPEKKEILGVGEIRISRKSGRNKIKIEIDQPKGVPLNENDLFPPLLKEIEIPPRSLLIEAPFFLLAPPLAPPLREMLGDIPIYDFAPKLLARVAPITGKAELEENGENLPIVLKSIEEKKEDKRKLLNLVKDLLPFVENLNVEEFADKSLLIKLKESYHNQYLPASLMSDGTINIIALIIALYFEKKPFIIIEEPERSLHPYLISKLVELMKEASQDKQIIVTTHNPELIKYAGLENILLVSRGEDGFSTISRPADKEEVRVFLENDIGVEELYIQNLLEV